MARKNFLSILEEKNPTVYLEMMEYLKEHGVEATSRKYAHVLQEDPTKLFFKLRTYMYNLRKEEKLKTTEKLEAKPTFGTLTEEEEQFLENFRKGEIDFEQVQREMAYRVLRHIMANPMLVKTSDWLKSEMVKLKREEISVKKGFLEAAWVKVFGGFLPPKKCPECGHSLETKNNTALEFTEAEVFTENDTQSLGATGSI